MIYCRHLMAEWQVAAPDLSATKGSIVTYEMVAALGATLFREEDREKVRASEELIETRALGNTTYNGVSLRSSLSLSRR